MTDDNPSVLSHLSVGTNDFARATGFYDQILAVLGCTRIMEHPGEVAYCKAYPEFWVRIPVDGKPANVGNGSHVSFVASTPAGVDVFHTAALAAGAQDEGAPGPREEYGAPYYGCFVRDPDGHKIEAAFWDESVGES